MNIPIERLDVTDSTNRVLKELAMDGLQPPYAVCALKQTHGRGRMDRSFISPNGGIYISFLFDYNKDLSLTAMAAVAVRRAILKVCGISCDIKWVNDLYYKGKKVCGILAEGVKDKIVLGIGINWAVDISDLPDVATTLGQSPNTANALIEELSNQIYGPLDMWLEEYRAADMLLGKQIRIIQAGVETGCGVARGITSDGFLIVEEEGVEVVLSTGEVSVRTVE